MARVRRQPSTRKPVYESGEPVKPRTALATYAAAGLAASPSAVYGAEPAKKPPLIQQVKRDIRQGQKFLRPLPTVTTETGTVDGPVSAGRTRMLRPDRSRRRGITQR